MSAPQPIVPAQHRSALATALAAWQKADEAAESAARQASAARAERAAAEARVLNLVAAAGLRAPTFRTAGMAVRVVDTRHTAGLTWRLLSEQLPSFFAAQRLPDVTANLVEHLRAHRDVTTTPALKRLE